MKPIAGVDYETDGITARPEYPPKPVGVAIEEGRKREYLAWGHPTGNNCTKAQAIRRLKQVYKRCAVVFHNAQFDLEVGSVHLGLPTPQEYHDTMILAFLNDPREENISLKPLADKYLDLPPEEQDRLREWILENIEGAHDHKKSKKAPHLFWAALICLAPGELVGTYAKGDVLRTVKLFRWLYHEIKRRGMLPAYQRELDLLLVTTQIEAGGIRINLRQLKTDVKQWRKDKEVLDRAVYRRLGYKFDIDSGTQLAEALDHAGYVDDFILTAKGNVSTSRENLEKCCTDKKVLQLLEHRSTLEKYLNTFALKWIDRASKADGYFYPKFNQIRSHNDYTSNSSGTKTGRYSSDFQQTPRNPYDEVKPWTKKLPRLRKYVIPDPGCYLLRRDYSQQELRILAHFEDGQLFQEYLKNPWLDVHDLALELILKLTGIKYPRHFIKTMGFGIIYGMGLAGISKKLDITRRDASQLKSAYFKALPGVKEVSDNLKELAADDLPFYTSGRREYYCEEPAYIDGELRGMEYKMLNCLIQGSAADCTKHGMLNLHSLWGLNSEARMALQVHDELLCNVPKGKEKKYMKDMTEAMEAVDFDVPMLTEGKIAKRNWADSVKYEALPKDRV